MESVSWERVKAVFHSMLSIPASERAAALTEACGEEPGLRAQVQDLLDAHAEADAEGGLGVPPEERGARIGPYKLLQKIGEGGFGVVYMAEQEKPVRRRVALKIIKPGMDSKQVIARFEAERQALAMMEHPNIARVLDAGTTSSGQPYFVMELVRGVPITEYCDANNLAPNERLELFADVCNAVQHAHQKGIIHRDIKPSNVLVTLHDDRPVPKVIDFGVAKATNQRLTEKTLFTEFRQLIGTPAYMSPEQAGISGLDVDTRSDIYSLGVLLYELLTGTQPFEPGTLHGAAVDEILRIIREVEPPKPSTRVSTLGASITEIAKHRGTDPELLGRSMRGDLDWIVMKALEKDRTRRYETAGELARDIGRHLADDPVLAGPPSTWYRLRKLVRRNRVAAAWGGLAAAGVLVGLCVSTVGLVAARRGRAQAREAEHQAQLDARRALQAEEDERAQRRRAERSRGEAEEQSARAEAEYARAAAALGFLDDTFAAADPFAAGGGARSLASLLDAATARLEAGELADQPLVEAQVRSTLGKTYRNLHLSGFETAELHLSRASRIWLEQDAADDADAVQGLIDLAELKNDQGVTAEAEALYREALQLARSRDREDLLQTALSSMGGFLTRCGAHDQEAFARAEDGFREALEIAERRNGLQHPAVVAGMNDLARALVAQEEFAEAEELLDIALEIARELHAGSHADIAGTLSSLGALERARGNHRAAERHLRAAFAMNWELEADDGGVPTATVEDAMALADLLISQGKADESVVLYRLVLEGAREILPEPHPMTAFVLRNLAEALRASGDLPGSEEAYLEALAMNREALGEDHQETVITKVQLGQLYFGLRRYPDAELLFLSSYEVMARSPAVPEEDRLFVVDRLARLFEATGRPEEAAVWRDRKASSPADTPAR